MGMFSSDEKEDLLLITEINKLREEIKELNSVIEARGEVIEEQRKLLKVQTNMIDVLSHKIGYNETKENIYDYKDRQKRIFQNKVNHGFNTTNIYQEARYILEEVAELMRAIEKNDRENMIEELADIIIFTYGCAEVARLGDLDAKVFEKMAINEKRVYTQTAEGDFVKTQNQQEENK